MDQHEHKLSPRPLRSPAFEGKQSDKRLLGEDGGMAVACRPIRPTGVLRLVRSTQLVIQAQNTHTVPAQRRVSSDVWQGHTPERKDDLDLAASPAAFLAPRASFGCFRQPSVLSSLMKCSYAARTDRVRGQQLFRSLWNAVIGWLATPGTAPHIMLHQGKRSPSEIPFSDPARPLSGNSHSRLGHQPFASELGPSYRGLFWSCCRE